MKKIFTVIICSYNSSSRIESIVDHIVNQFDYSTLVNELLLINNNSSDDTEFCMEKCKKKCDNIRVISEPKPGLSNARKRGILESNSEWIIFIDDDNYLTENWIHKSYEYIKNNPNVGAFNGVVIPRFEYELDNNKELMIRASLKVLACTHMNREEIYNNKNPFRTPIGAGLVIRTKPLQELCNNGWLKCSGRTAGNLGSGEDGEMCMHIKHCGYDFGFNKEIILEHLLPDFRLEITYLEKIWKSIATGVYDVIRGQKLYNLKSIVYYILIKFRLLIKKYCKNRYEYYFYSIYVNEIKSRIFNKNLEEE